MLIKPAQPKRLLAASLILVKADIRRIQCGFL
jgi:hypothetical protein